MPDLTTSMEAFDPLEEEWKTLFHASGSTNPFLSWEWTKKYATTYAADKHCSVLTVRDDNAVLLLAPFSLSGKKLTFFADPMLADYAGILCMQEHAGEVTRLVDQLNTQDSWNKSVLGPIRSNSIIVGTFEKHLEDTNTIWRRERICGNPLVNTTANYQDYMAGKKKKKLRQEIRTTINHLNRMGEWQFSTATNGAEAHRIYDALVEFHTDRQSGKAGTSIFKEDENIEFFRRLIDKPNPSFDTHLSAIEVDGRVVSAALSIRCGTVLYYWIPSFDQSMKSISLGKLHINCLLEECFDGQISSFDFMGGDEPYKYQWANENYDLYRYILYKGKLGALLDSQREQIRGKLKNAKDNSSALKFIWHWASKLTR